MIMFNSTGAPGLCFCNKGGFEFSFARNFCRNSSFRGLLHIKLNS